MVWGSDLTRLKARTAPPPSARPRWVALSAAYLFAFFVFFAAFGFAAAFDVDFFFVGAFFFFFAVIGMRE